MKLVRTLSSFSVDDTKKAKEFYTKILDFKVSEVKNMNGLLNIHLTGDSNVMVYTKPDHVPATFTVLNLVVDNVENAVNELNKKGIRFEVYNQPGIKTDEKGISNEGGIKIAWFKDPAGNILSVIEEK